MKKKEQLQGDLELYQKYIDAYDERKKKYEIMFDNDIASHVNSTFTEEEVDLVMNTFKILENKVSFMDIAMNVFLSTVSITMSVLVIKSDAPSYFLGFIIMLGLLVVTSTFIDIKKYITYKKLMKKVK